MKYFASVIEASLGVVYFVRYRTLTCNVLLYSLSALLFTIELEIASAQIPVPELHAIAPSGLAVGATGRVDVLAGKWITSKGGVATRADGIDFDLVDSLVFSNPGIQATRFTKEATKDGQQPSADSFGASFQVSVAAHVEEGIYEVRLKGKLGMSNSRLFHVTKLPWTVLSKSMPADPTGTSSDLAPLVLDHYFQGQCEARQWKRYAISLSTKQSVKIYSMTKSIDSRARLIFQVFDPDQREIYRLDGNEDADTVLDLEVDHPGQYEVRVADHLYRGGLEFPFVLNVANQIHHPTSLEPKDELANEMIALWRQGAGAIDSVRSYLPPPGDASISTNEKLTVHTLGSKSVTLRPPASGVTEITIDARQHESSNVVRGVGTKAAIHPTPITSPSLVQSAFTRIGNRHWYELELSGGVPWVIEIASERLGQDSDLELSIGRIVDRGSSNERFQVMATLDDTTFPGDMQTWLDTRDPVLSFSPPESGKYLLLVRNHEGIAQGRDRLYYAMEIRHSTPDWTLLSMPMYPVRSLDQLQMFGLNVSLGGATAISLQAIRHDGMKNPIEIISSVSSSIGIHTRPVRIAGNQNSSTMVLTTPPEAVSASAVHVFEGYAISDGNQPTESHTKRQAIPLELEWGATPTRSVTNVRRSLGRVVSLVDQQRVPIQVSLGPGAPIQAKLGEKIKVPIQVVRGEGGSQNVIARVRGLPPKCTVNEVTLAGDQTSGEFEFQIAGDAVPGEYSIWAQCESTLKMSPFLGQPVIDLPAQVPSQTANLLVLP